MGCAGDGESGEGPESNHVEVGQSGSERSEGSGGEHGSGGEGAGESAAAGEEGSGAPWRRMQPSTWFAPAPG